MDVGDAHGIEAVDAAGKAIGSLAFGKWVAIYRENAIDLGEVNQTVFAGRYVAERYGPVKLLDTYAPIAHQEQLGAVEALVIAHQRRNRPVLDYGFDFSLNTQRFNTAELNGIVGYRKLAVSALRVGSQ